MNDAMPQFDRRVEDLGNIVELGHVNVTVPDQRLATIFYISGLGLTRDPYLMSGVDNMWANVGRAQFHLPSRDATRPGQVVRGTTGLVLPDLPALLGRLGRVAPMLAGTKFSFRETNDAVEVTCPWGTASAATRRTQPGSGRSPLGCRMWSSTCRWACCLAS